MIMLILANILVLSVATVTKTILANIFVLEILVTKELYN